MLLLKKLKSPINNKSLLKTFKRYFSQNDLSFDKYPFLIQIGLAKENLGCYNGKEWCGSNQTTISVNPADNTNTAIIKLSSEENYEQCISNMQKVQEKWSSLSMVSRGLIAQEIGQELKKNKETLGSIISLEMGKIYSEGLGEVQEAIDICDYAMGLSRTISGKILASERQDHIQYENWNPIGLMGCISAFNFPHAVLGWNAAISMICGNLTMWKGAPTTTLVSIATTKIITNVLEKHGYGGVFTMISETGKTLSEKMSGDKRLPLISFTGSSEVYYK